MIRPYHILWFRPFQRFNNCPEARRPRDLPVVRPSHPGAYDLARSLKMSRHNRGYATLAPSVFAAACRPARAGIHPGTRPPAQIRLIKILGKVARTIFEVVLQFRSTLWHTVNRHAQPIEFILLPLKKSVRQRCNMRVIWILVERTLARFRNGFRAFLYKKNDKNVNNPLYPPEGEHVRWMGTGTRDNFGEERDYDDGENSS